MSVDSSPSAPKWQAYCPDCGGKFLNIWIGGRVHCGNCSKGGVIWSPHYEHLLNLQSGLDGGKLWRKSSRFLFGPLAPGTIPSRSEPCRKFGRSPMPLSIPP